MDIKELNDFAKESEEKLSRYFNKSKSELTLIHTLKLGEETGEVFEQVLSIHNAQRKEKAVNKEEIGEEIADVLLVGFILANNLNIDIERELKNKIEKNRKRLS